MPSGFAGVQGDILVTSLPSVSLTDDTLTDSGNHTTFVEATAAHRYWDNTAAFTIQAQLDEIQSVTITGAPTGGTFTLTFGGQTTATIAYNASAATVQSALQALSSIGSGNCSVSGSTGGPWTVEFLGTLKDAAQSLMTGNGGSLTGGTSPGVSIARVQGGQAWGALATSFTIQYVGGTVILASALQGSNIGVRAHAGKYFPYASIGNTTDWQFQGTTTLQESTSHQGVGGSTFSTFLPLLTTGKVTLKKWWVDNTMVNHLVSRDLLVLSCVTPDGSRLEGYCYVGQSNIQTAVNKLVESALTFQLTNQIVIV